MSLTISAPRGYFNRAGNSFPWVRLVEASQRFEAWSAAVVALALGKHSDLEVDLGHSSQSLKAGGQAKQCHSAPGLHRSSSTLCVIYNPRKAFSGRGFHVGIGLVSSCTFASDIVRG